MRKLVLLLIAIFLFLFSDFQLGKYGRGFKIFNKYLPYGFELIMDTQFNPIIVEEGFIHVLSSNNEIKPINSEKVIVNRLLCYSVSSKRLFVVVDTNKGKKIYEIVLDEKRDKGTQLYYLEVQKMNTSLNWIDLSSNKNVWIILHIFSLILIIIIAIKSLGKVIKHAGS